MVLTSSRETQFVLLVLAVFSVVSWYFIDLKWWQFRRMRQLGDRFLAEGRHGHGHSTQAADQGRRFRRHDAAPDLVEAAPSHLLLDRRRIERRALTLVGAAALSEEIKTNRAPTSFAAARTERVPSTFTRPAAAMCRSAIVTCL